MIILNKNRRGYALIEMHAVMSGLLLVLVLTSLAIHQSLRIDRGERARMTVGASLERLAHDFRGDCREATGPIDRKDAQAKIPQGNTQTVEYVARKADVLRTVTVNGKHRSHETYPKPKGTTIKFVTRGDGVALVVQAAAGQVVDPIYRDYAIEAQPGRHARLTSVGAKQ